MERPVDAGRVDEHELAVVQVLDGEDPVPRRLRLVRDDRDLGADDQVEERGLAGVGTADERDEPGACHYRRSTGASCARRKRTLWMRRRSASSTSTCRPSRSNVSPDRGHAADAGQHVAADGLEAFGLDRDVQAIADLVDAGLGAEHPRAVALVHDGLGLDVVLVPDLADDLLEQILERHEPGGAAVLVDDDGHLHLPALELLEELGHALGLGHEHRRTDEAGDRLAGARPARSAAPDPSRRPRPGCCRGSP